MLSLETLVEKLNATSERDYPLPTWGLEWPDQFPEDAWAFSPEMLSLAGQPVLDTLSESQLKRLALLEAANFFSLNINGEKSLIEGLARQCYRPQTHAVTSYIHHFLEEESRHMRTFGAFCLKYVGKTYPDKKLVFEREYADGEEDFLFWTKVMLFEETADAYNVRMAADERLHPLVRGIHKMHHHDESRHLAFGRQMLRDAWQRHAGEWDGAVREGIRSYLLTYLTSVWREYHNPAVYRDAGLPDAYGLFTASFESDTARQRRGELSAKPIKFLTDIGVFEEVPTW
ncbi:MAG: diiron oxygenase [Candidatus Sericytochromatia bacterium]|nr:diiron oxygenase [Candidatus Sericytochromatia bacterium]